MVLYLVDDEKNIRESIKTYIPWGDFGVTQVITAKSGLEALEKMELNPPDVILSDIRMPKMNGIEFATKAKALYPDSVILFLSGYADKEYLKSAIQLEAFQYIEKPIDIHSLQSILADAVSKKKTIQKHNKHLNDLEQSHTENLHIIRQNLINSLISSNTQELSKKAIDSINLFTKIPSHTFLMAYIKFNWPRDLSDAILYDAKNKILQLTLSEEWISSTLTGFNIENDFVILIDGNYSGLQTTSLLASLTNQFSFPYTYSIGLSKSRNTLQGSRVSYLEAKNASAYQFYYGPKQHIEFSNFYNTVYNLSPTLITEFNEALKNPDINDITNVLQKINTDILANKPEISNVKGIYTALFTFLDNEARKTNNSNYDFIKIKQIIKIIDEAYLFNDIHVLLVQHINSYYDAQVQIGSNNNRIKEIVQYIKKGISNSQLSVNTISDAFSLSQAYLCSYFKKETNLTINQYITTLRIEQSKYLLTNTNDKIYDIALKVGFSDTNYFSALFKKQVGITPLEFRKGK